jgi:Family of unknown function (DUF5995)
MRTTRAVKDDLAQGGFVDADWTERWDVVFADMYLDALEAWNATGDAPGPWAIAFGAANDTPRVPPLRHLLLGMNAHINYDLPQSLIEVISDDESPTPTSSRGARRTTRTSTRSSRAGSRPRTGF